MPDDERSTLSPPPPRRWPFQHPARAAAEGARMIRVVRLGEPRVAGEGLRIGTVRRPPRGVRKEDLARRDFYDVWYPLLAPSEELRKAALVAEGDRAWIGFVKRFRREMARPEASRSLDLLAALSHQTDFSLGCYCAEEARCHGSVLRALLEDRAAIVAPAP